MDKFGVIREGQTPPRNPNEKTVEELDESLEKKAAERAESRRVCTHERNNQPAK